MYCPEMPKKLIQRFLPDHKTIQEHKSLRFLSEYLSDPNLWHLNRHSVSKAFAIGLFAAWLPTLGQMLIAATGAILFRGNLPISVVLVLITNPVTSPPMFYFAYRIGAWTLNVPPMVEQMNYSFEGILTTFGTIWQPFLLGCSMLSIISALSGYAAVKILWRIAVIHNWNKRKASRL